ncbi:MULTISPECIES: PrgI family protein [unclassified Crossiella]|uniref:PrgI family protein n=1 Tax=unclassified Crossiella TaxID=2620835 RepID=UPI001FFF5342|nr:MULTISPECIES: PrgI family protein [unclassified Crossiella]MCK2243675.1 PrgI family protein [Crossiella sp. S99.2]MCK2257534.1 PrgI family protein [Crossiella sp. S99.1]
MARREHEVPMTVPVPADIDRPDRIAFGLTARQLAVLGAIVAGLWGLYEVTADLVPIGVFLTVAVPVTGIAIVAVIGRRNGQGFDQLLWAVLGHHRAPRRLVPAQAVPGKRVPDAPSWVQARAGALPGPLRLPVTAISPEGVLDLGRDGQVVQCACSGVNFGLRTPGEQRVLVAGFARWLHSLTGPAQIVVRADRLNLDPVITTLREIAPSLPHPALEDACHAHAAFLEELSGSRDLLRRQILLVLATPAAGSRRQAGGQQAVLRQAALARQLLASAEVHVRPLDGADVQRVLAAATDPHGDPAPPGDVASASGTVTAAPTLLHPNPDPDGR